VLGFILIVFSLLLISGCTSYGFVVRQQQEVSGTLERCSNPSHAKRSSRRNYDIYVMSSFSGGETRVVAFSYGVLEALRDTEAVIDRRSERLLDEVTTIRTPEYLWPV
jgi:hypothetical protein